MERSTAVRPMAMRRGLVDLANRAFTCCWLSLLLTTACQKQIASPLHSDSATTFATDGTDGNETAPSQEPHAGNDKSEVATTNKPSLPIKASLPIESDLDLHPDLVGQRFDAAIRDITVLEDPVLDGWDTEHFSDLAGQQLKKIGKLLTHPDSISAPSLTGICSPRITGTSLRPARLLPAFEDNSLAVHRGASSGSFSGPAEFAEALRQQSAALQGAAAQHFKFKTIRVQLHGRTAETTAYFHLDGNTARSDTSVQANSTWHCTWESRGKSQLPLLTRVRVQDYEETKSKSDRPLFEDCTMAALAGLPVLDQQLVYGRDHWYGHLEAALGIEGRGNGIAIGDANGDGLDDIYLCQPAALPNLLLLRQADGSLKDASKATGLDWLDSTRGALFVDIDNDGDQDLLLAHSTNLILHENQGQGDFVFRGIVKTNSRLFSLNAIDYDLDGDLDLFACGYSGAGKTRAEDIFASPVPYHDANNGAPNVLLRNDRDWQFRDVTADAGLDSQQLKFSLASVWEDFDNDGDPDLYIANDFGRNNLYRNDDGHFVDIAKQAGVEDMGPGMSAAWGDYNNDGLIDLYVSNMFSSAGSRITHNAQFKPGANQNDLEGFRRHARGNSLFRNNGDGTFADMGVASNTTMGRWAWGSQLFDINNDGWRDIYVTNGFVTADHNNDL